MKTGRRLAAAAALALCACIGLDGTTPPPDARQQGARGPEGWSGGRLYARDGSVVAGADASGAEDGAPAPRDLAPSESGRMYILELYQNAIDQRDALDGEVRSLNAELERVKAELAKSDAEIAALQARVAALEAEGRRLLDENVELAARLTTAQIRRLQAEKILLETRLAQQRAGASEAAAAAPEATSRVEKKD